MSLAMLKHTDSVISDKPTPTGKSVLKDFNSKMTDKVPEDLLQPDS